jgi:metal-responsive CopG/Arc/MetJ family transcriptional regulator
MKSYTKIGISLPQEMLEDIDSIRRISNRSKFIVDLIRKPLELLKEEDSLE